MHPGESSSMRTCISSSGIALFVVLFLLQLVAQCQAADSKQGVFPTGKPPSPGIAPANVFNGLVFTSAYFGNTGVGNVSTIPEDFADEVRTLLNSMNNTLLAAGSSLENVLSIEIRLANASLKAELDPIFGETFGDSPVARSMYVVDNFDLFPFVEGARIQATAIAAQAASAEVGLNSALASGIVSLFCLCLCLLVV